MNDRELADLLGEAPASPDPAFRLDVLARTAARARKRVVRRRAVHYVAAFTALGLAVPALRSLGLTAGDVQPLLLSAGAILLAYVFALLSIEGPAAVLQRSRVLLRVHP
jgi:hypothetical protein